MHHGEQVAAEHAFSLTEGGPFYRLLTRLRIRTPTSSVRAWWLGFAFWLPIAIGEGVRYLRGQPLDQMMFDLSVHVRLLFALPVMLIFERTLERASRSAIASFEIGELCDRAALDEITARAERLRDSRLVEGALIGLALLGGQLVLWGAFGAAGWIGAGDQAGLWSLPRVWYAVIALPLVQFVMFRWLWRWLIWCYVLARLARLPLAPLATHPDFAAALTPLTRPISGFGGFVLAFSAVLAGAWETKVLTLGATLPSLLPGLVAFAMMALVAAVGPLLLFCGHLFRSRRTALKQYGDFAREYTLRFHEKWIEPPTARRQEPLGTPDLQSLNDLGGAFQVIAKTRLFVFGPRTVLMVWAAALLPMVPLFASALTVEQVLKQIIRTVLGGLPL